MKKILSLFSGIGAFEKALENMNEDYELVNYCEIDKYASKTYVMIHNCKEEKNLGDIINVDTTKLSKKIDVVTYGFPCQDISLAGKQRGFEENGIKTRSGLFFEALRIIEDIKPKIAIAENVKNLVSKKFKNEFGIVLHSLDQAGYNNYYEVMNAKDYGIPQNRERVFIISIRKDIDTNKFQFPLKKELDIRLKDMLDKIVDKKYYLSEEKIKEIKFNELVNYDKTDKTICLNSKGGRNGVEDVQPSLQNRIYDSEGISPAITTCFNPYIAIREATKQGYNLAYEGDCVNLSYPKSKTRRGRIGRGVAQTLTTKNGLGVVVKNEFENLTIRNLTPKEQFRLMGFKDEDFDKITGISESQLIKQAGNSIVVNVIEFLFNEVFKVLDEKKKREEVL